jgi:hypothetical protein
MKRFMMPKVTRSRGLHWSLECGTKNIEEMFLSVASEMNASVS